MPNRLICTSKSINHINLVLDAMIFRFCWVCSIYIYGLSWTHCTHFHHPGFGLANSRNILTIIICFPHYIGWTVDVLIKTLIFVIYVWWWIIEFPDLPMFDHWTVEALIFVIKPPLICSWQVLWRPSGLRTCGWSARAHGPSERRKAEGLRPETPSCQELEAPNIEMFGKKIHMIYCNILITISIS